MYIATDRYVRQQTDHHHHFMIHLLCAYAEASSQLTRSAHPFHSHSTISGHNVVDRIITDMCVFDCDKAGGTGLTLVEIAPGITVDDVRKATACDFKVADPLPLMDDE